MRRRLLARLATPRRDVSVGNALRGVLRHIAASSSASLPNATEGVLHRGSLTLAVALCLWLFGAQNASVQAFQPGPVIHRRPMTPAAMLSNQIYFDAQALRAMGNAYTAIGIARQANATAASMEMDNKVKWVSTYFERRQINREARAAERPPYIDREEKRQEMRRRLIANNLSASSGDLTDELNWMLREILANTSYSEFMSDTPNSMMTSEHNAPLSNRERHEIQLSEGKVAGGGGMKFSADTGEVLETAWPLILRDDQFKAARKAFEDARDWAIAELKNDQQVTKAGSDRLMAAVDRLTAELTAAYPRERRKTMSPRDGLAYLAAKRFVQSLAESTFRLIETNSAVAFDDSYRFQGKSVAELMQHLMSRGLQFAQPKKGGELTYRKLYNSIRGFYLKIVPAPSNDVGPPLFN